MRRTLRPLAALAMVALLSAGCSNALAGTGTGSGGGSNTAATAPAQTGIGSGGGSNATNRDQAVKFAECMRKNGVREFPDPDASGDLTIDRIANGSSLDTSTAAFKQAISACRDLEPPGFTGGKRSPEQQKAALKFAQCIRDNGVKDFPDPTPDGPLVDTSRMPGSPGARSIPGLQAAMEKCSAIYSGELGLKGQ
jgi:hypothetical protein